MCQFSGRTDNIDFFCPNLHKSGHRTGNSESYCWNKNQHLWDTMCANFLTKQATLTFPAQICPKIDLASELQKSNSGFGISTSKIPCVLIFSQNGQLWIFGLNLGKLSNYMRYFGSNNVESVTESWVEAEMSRVEVDGGR